MKPKISQTYLKSLLDYNLESGIFTWVTDHARNKVGDKARATSNGYIRIGIDGVGYSAHRLAFIYVNGSEPDLVDHINGVRSDNRWVNLRASNKRQNTSNTTHSRSSTGVRGISFNKSSRKYEVRVKPSFGKIIFRSFESLREAELFNNETRSLIYNDQ